MATRARYDVFLSHSAKDKAVVREVAERLRADGLKVWFDEWEIKPGDSIRARIEAGLEDSRVLVFCMSAAAFGSDWAQLERHTHEFDDPLNRERRFIPLRLDEAPVKRALAQFSFIDWLPSNRSREYPRLLEACRPPAPEAGPAAEAQQRFLDKVMSLGHADWVRSVAWSPDGRRALSGAYDKTLRVWDLDTGHCLRVLEGHSNSVWSVAWSPDGRRALSGAADNSLRAWDLDTGYCLRVLEGHSDNVLSVAWSPDGRRALSGAADNSLRAWDLDTGRCLRVLEGHSDRVWSVVWSPDGRRALSGAADNSLRVWDLDTGRCLRVLEGHSANVLSVAWSSDGRRALSGAADNSLRVWDLDTGHCLRVLEGHSNSVWSAAWSPDGRRALSGAADNSLRVWDLDTGHCLRVLEDHSDNVWSVAWSPDGRRALSGAADNSLRVWNVDTGHCLRVLEGHSDRVFSVAWRPDGRRTVSGAADSTLRVWNVDTGHCLRVLEGHSGRVFSVTWSPDGRRALSGADDSTLRVWNVDTGHRLRVLEGHSDRVFSVAWSPDGRRALSGAADNSLRVWDLDTGHCLRVLEGHSDWVWSVAWSPDGRRALSGAADKTLRVWNVDTGRCQRVLEGHSDSVFSVAWSPDGRRALSGADDKTLRVWDVDTGRCQRVLEGHSGSVSSVAWSPDGRRALSGAADNSLRVWDIDTGHCQRVLEGHSDGVSSVAWSPDGRRALSGAVNGVMRVWILDDAAETVAASAGPFTAAAGATADQVQYTNAKVLLVGESGVGKSGLSRYLAHGILVEDDKPLPSTDGAWATHWPLPHAQKTASVQREIWLWDFAGQVDYRLVHQLFMDDTSAAVLVFNPQNENPFDGLGRWDRDLVKATRRPFAKFLVAGRVDRGGLVVSRTGMDDFMKTRGFVGPLHLTSAKTATGCDALRDAIVDAIDWQGIPETTSPTLYHRMKQEILALRDAGLVLVRQAELKQRLQLALPGLAFTPEELSAVVNLLAGPGMVRALDFGGFTLLRPEVLSRYAAAVVRKVRQHPQELGCIYEDQMLAGDLDYQDFVRLPPDDEQIVLRALHETFISRAWCLRQTHDNRPVLAFPSYFRRERPEQVEHPHVLVTYRFSGPVDEIYATLVVRLHHTVAFETDQLWNLAADFKTQTGERLGFKLTRAPEGSSSLEIYFAADVDPNTRVLFLRYVHNHLTEHARTVERLRHYACGNKRCERRDQPFADRRSIDEALAPGGTAKVFCPKCGKPIPLRDAMETRFESPAVKNEARELQAGGQEVIDNESRELILVGHAYAIVAEAGQIYRGYTNSDHGIDGEIEFKDDQGRATGKRLYVQLKSGDSYLRKRARDGVEVFRIEERWAAYWQSQAYPVMLVIRTSNGEIRWMDVSTYLKRERDGGQPSSKQLSFEGERFDARSLRRWRDRVLGATQPALEAQGSKG